MKKKKILLTFPPSSKTTGVRVFEAFSMTLLPTSGEPINKTLSVSETTADPASPYPVTYCTKSGECPFAYFLF